MRRSRIVGAMRKGRAVIAVVLAIVAGAAAAYYLRWRSKNYEDGTRVYLVREHLHCDYDAPEELRKEGKWPGACRRCSPDEQFGPEQNKVCALLGDYARSAIACYKAEWRDKMAGEDRSMEVCWGHIDGCNEERARSLRNNGWNVSDCYILRHHREPL